MLNIVNLYFFKIKSARTMSEYKGAKAGKLKLKNVNQSVGIKKAKKKKKVEKIEEYTNIISKEARKEAKKNGGWWIVETYDMIPVGKNI